MRAAILPALACLGVFEGYGVAVQGFQTSGQLAALGVALGTLTAVFYLYRDELSKRLDRIERQLDLLVTDRLRMSAP